MLDCCMYHVSSQNFLMVPSAYCSKLHWTVIHGHSTLCAHYAPIHSLLAICLFVLASSKPFSYQSFCAQLCSNSQPFSCLTLCVHFYSPSQSFHCPIPSQLFSCQPLCAHFCSPWQHFGSLHAKFCWFFKCTPPDSLSHWHNTISNQPQSSHCC